jgi:peptidoglycan/LPS O-acetylase OafA/YrhL
VHAPAPTGVRTARLGVLDALRFGAALSVVAFHFTGITPAWGGGVRAPSDVDALGRWAVYGAMGVPLFFVISGFVVLMTAWGRDVPRFVASRVGRLFPAYWAAVGIAMLFAFVIWPAGSDADGHPFTKVDALVNLTMLQGGLGTPDLVGAFWTLWTEARFYLLIALFIVVGINRRRVLAFATLWPIAGILADRAGDHLLSTLLIADYSPYFAGGMLLYVIHREGHDLGTWLLVGLQSLLALRFALGYYPGALPRATGWATSNAGIALISMACFGLVALVTLTSLNRLSAPWMSFLGALTYPVYLVHEKVGFFVIHVLRGEVSPWLAMGAAAGAALSVATVLHYAVERPWGGRLRALTQRTLEQASPSQRASATAQAAPVRGSAEPETRTDATPVQQPPAPVYRTLGPEVVRRPVPDVVRRASRDPRVPVPAAARD